MENALALFGIAVCGYILFLNPFLHLRKVKKQEAELFESEFAKFNKTRFNPLEKDFYKVLHDYTFSSTMIYFSRGEIGSGNQRDGDELMSNSQRNPAERIADHLDFKKIKRGTTSISSLGYNFTKKDHFMSFVKLFLETMPEGVICIPINKTWAVFVKRSDGKVNISYDQSILTNKDYQYLTME